VTMIATPSVRAIASGFMVRDISIAPSSVESEI
jgi:hypothetical protein